MLTEHQIGRVWENMIAAEARSLYFGDLASRYARQKQWITGASFFLSSGAAASIAAKSPIWLPLVASCLVAACTAYSIAFGLDRKITTMAKLHSAWREIAENYDRLWNHTYEDGSEQEFDAIVRKEKEPSELAAVEAPHEPDLLARWEQHVFEMYNLKEQAA